MALKDVNPDNKHVSVDWKSVPDIKTLKKRYGFPISTEFNPEEHGHEPSKPGKNSDTTINCSDS